MRLINDYGFIYRAKRTLSKTNASLTSAVIAIALAAFFGAMIVASMIATNANTHRIKVLELENDQLNEALLDIHMLRLNSEISMKYSKGALTAAYIAGKTVGDLHEFVSAEHQEVENESK